MGILAGQACAGHRLFAIREACKLAPDQRTEENVDDVFDFVKDVQVIESLTFFQQRALCRAMVIERFQPHAMVFDIGEAGDKFYIVLAGSVNVQVPQQAAPCPRGKCSSR